MYGSCTRVVGGNVIGCELWERTCRTRVAHGRTRPTPYLYHSPLGTACIRHDTRVEVLRFLLSTRGGSFMFTMAADISGEGSRKFAGFSWGQSCWNWITVLVHPVSFKFPPPSEFPRSLVTVSCPVYAYIERLYMKCPWNSVDPFFTRTSRTSQRRRQATRHDHTFSHDTTSRPALTCRALPHGRQDILFR